MHSKEVISVVQETAELTKSAITCPQDVYTWAKEESIHIRTQEHVYAINIDSKHRPINHVLVSKGGLNTAVVHPRDAMREAVIANAYGVILLHNHPSGDPEPSEEDLRLTSRFMEAGTLLGIQLLDHLIVARDSYISLKERGVIA